MYARRDQAPADVLGSRVRVSVKGDIYDPDGLTIFNDLLILTKPQLINMTSPKQGRYIQQFFLIKVEGRSAVFFLPGMCKIDSSYASRFVPMMFKQLLEKNGLSSRYFFSELAFNTTAGDTDVYVTRNAYIMELTNVDEEDVPEYFFLQSYFSGHGSACLSFRA